MPALSRQTLPSVCSTATMHLMTCRSASSRPASRVTYTYQNRPATAVAAGRVQQPGSLAVPTGGNTTQVISCSVNGQNYNTQQRQIQYQVLDTSSPPVPIQALNMDATESFNTSTNTCAVSDPTPTINAHTGSNGNFPAPDQLSLCSAKCLPPDVNANPTGSCQFVTSQTWTVNGFAVKTSTITYSCPGPPTGVP